MTMQFCSRSILRPSLSLLLFLPLASAPAVTETWDGGGADNKLTTGANWADNTAPVNSASLTDVVFAGTVRPAPLLDSDRVFHSLKFAAGAGAFHITQPAGSFDNLYVDAGGLANLTGWTQTLDTLGVSDDPAVPTPIAAGSGTLLIADFGGYYDSVNGYAYPGYAAMTGNISITNPWSYGAITFNGGGTLVLSRQADCACDLKLNSGTVKTTGPFTWGDSSIFFPHFVEVTLSGGSFLPDDDLTIYGGSLNRAAGAGFALPAGKTFMLLSGSANFTGSYAPSAAWATVLGTSSTFTATSSIALGSGSSMSVAGSADVSAGSYFDVGNGSAGTLTATGAGTTITAHGTSDWGYSAAGSVTLSDKAAGAYDTLRIAGGFGSGASNGTALVQSGATLVTGPLQIGATPTVGGAGTLTVAGAGSTVTIGGASALTLGSASGANGRVNVENGAAFTTGTGASTVAASGKIVTTGAAAVTFKGDTTFTGGLLDMAASPAGVLTLVGSRVLRFQSGADALLGGSFTVDNNASLQVNGAGSTFQSSGGAIEIKNGSITVEAGALLGAHLGIPVGNGGGGTLTVDNASLSAASASQWGNNGGAANVTLRNNAFAAVPGLQLATTGFGSIATLLVQSGADLNTASISAGTSGLAGTATLTVTGAGSSIMQSGASTFTLGAAVDTVATLNIGTSGVFQTGTGVTTIAPTGVVNMTGGLFYTNGPLIHNGQIVVNGGGLIANGSATLNGQISAGASGSLLFHGPVTGTSQFDGPGYVEFSGSYSPGAAPGAVATVTFQSSAGFMPTNTLKMEIAGPASMDHLNFQGTEDQPLTWGGTLIVNPAGGFQPQAGQSFDLFDFVPAGAIGTFSYISLPSLPPQLFWRTDRLYTDGVIFVSSTAQTWSEFQGNYDLEGFDTDRDGDGISDGLEFILGTSPVIPGNGDGPLVRLNVAQTPSRTVASFYFDMPEWPGLDAHYVIQASSDLTNWSTIAQKTGTGAWTGSAGVVTSLVSPGISRVVVTETLPPGTDRRFHRLLSEAPQP